MRSRGNIARCFGSDFVRAVHKIKKNYDYERVSKNRESKNVHFSHKIGG